MPLHPETYLSLILTPTLTMPLHPETYLSLTLHLQPARPRLVHLRTWPDIARAFLRSNGRSKPIKD